MFYTQKSVGIYVESRFCAAPAEEIAVSIRASPYALQLIHKGRGLRLVKLTRRLMLEISLSAPVFRHEHVCVGRCVVDPRTMACEQLY